MKAKLINSEFQNKFEDSCTQYWAVAKRTNEFKFGWKSLEYVPRSGQPICATTLELIAKVHNIDLEDRRLKSRENAEAVEVSYEWVYHILMNWVWKNSLIDGTGIVNPEWKPRHNQRYDLLPILSYSLLSDFQPIRLGIPTLFFSSFSPSRFMTCSAILPTSFDCKRPHFKRWLVSQPFFRRSPSCFPTISSIVK